MKKIFLTLVMALFAVGAFAQNDEVTGVRIPSGYQGFFEMGNTLLHFDKNISTTTFTIGATTYENVHVDQGSYMTDTTMVPYAWYYSEQQGLIAAKHGDYSLTLIP